MACYRQIESTTENRYQVFYIVYERVEMLQMDNAARYIPVAVL